MVDETGGGRRGRQAALTMTLALGLLAGATPLRAAVDRDSLRAECDYGITLALIGEWAHAESVFVSLLSHAPSDPRALTNLGNVNLLRGDPQAALAFYDAAVRRDTADAGIRLNRATAMMLMGDQDRALPEAAEGVRRAGGERAAAALLGLGTGGPPPPEGKGAAPAQVTRDEVRALLAAAVGRVPADTVGAGPAKARAAETGRKKPPSWRSAGPRGAAESEATTVLYWKR
jgi:tetratricopeptide (TPR) repeat protein